MLKTAQASCIGQKALPHRTRALTMNMVTMLAVKPARASVANRIARVLYSNRNRKIVLTNPRIDNSIPRKEYGPNWNDSESMKNIILRARIMHHTTQIAVHRFLKDTVGKLGRE